jgi:hypothetical protein
MREHEPVESDKTYGFEGQSDEETPTVEVLTKETGQIALIQSTA